jgi:excisionase family DNA binding protein
MSDTSQAPLLLDCEEKLHDNEAWAELLRTVGLEGGMTVDQVAKRVKRSKRTVQEWIAKRLLGYHLLGQQTKIITPTQLKEMVAATEVKAVRHRRR